MRPYIIAIIFNFFILESNTLECIVNKQNPSGVAYNIIVAQDGNGNFSKVQDAVNLIPNGNPQWIAIYLNPGIYMEQVVIPKEKECIILIGRSAQETIITNDNHDRPLLQATASFTASADNFMAKGITFKNTYKENNIALHNNSNIPSNSPAIAFLADGDKQAYYKCGFVGYQDTLNDQQGRHYFSNCYVEGVVDFIFGGGQSVYERCTINATGGGYITAQNRDSASNSGGYVFNNCQISGNNNQVNLGRAYGPFSRVIYMKSRFDNNIITPEGWSIWDQAGHEKDVTYAEVNCNGTDTSKRVLEKVLSPGEIEQFSIKAFLNQDGWIDRLPCFTCDSPNLFKYRI